MADNDIEVSSPVTKEDSINAIPETSSADLEIHDIQGIGPTTAKKLKEAGIVSVMDLAVTSADVLAVDINALMAVTYSSNEVYMKQEHSS